VSFKHARFNNKTKLVEYATAVPAEKKRNKARVKAKQVRKSRRANRG